MCSVQFSSELMFHARSVDRSLARVACTERGIITTARPHPYFGFVKVSTDYLLFPFTM